ncbi:MAG: methyltransferase domain-containing protein [Alphaproteobacteria bacterium]|nr:methyltransferase domain-containing protein [Alphaproteobacteria bacterium]
MSGARSPDPHALLMDRTYRHQRHVYDFTRKYYLFGRDRLIAQLALPPGSSLVEVGCGTARNLIRVARAYPGTRLYGLDASVAMLASAQAAVDRAGLTGRIQLAQGLAENLSPKQFKVESFDHVLFSYSLSMIPGWRQALAAASRSLSSTGQIHVVDFGDLAGLGRAGRTLLRAWLTLFHVKPRVEFLSALEDVTGRTATRLYLLPGRYAFIFSCDRM